MVGVYTLEVISLPLILWGLTVFYLAHGVDCSPPLLSKDLWFLSIFSVKFLYCFFEKSSQFESLPTIFFF